MNNSYPSSSNGSKIEKDDDLCNTVLLCGLNERPGFSLQCHDRPTTPLLYDTHSTGLDAVSLIAESDVDVPLQKMDCSISQPSAPGNQPGARFYPSVHNGLADKVAAFSNKPEESSIEVSPGIRARLRGAKETLECVENDFYLPTICFCCSQDLFCIMDASFVLCPKCRVINPMEGCADGLEGGVGIGFTFADLREFQTEILLRQRGHSKFY